MRYLISLLLLLLCTEVLPGQGAEIFTREDFTLESPDFFARGVETEVEIYCHAPEKLFVLGYEVPAIINGQQKVLSFKDNRAIFKVSFDRKEPFSLKVGRYTYVKTINPMPLWLSVVPPLLVILLALVFREVVSSLIIGILAGSVIAAVYAQGPGAWWTGFLRLIDTYMIEAFTDEGHASVIIFSTLIGGIVAVISKNGGMQAIVDKISKRASNPQSGQMATWILGVAIFFDDYANTLVVGNTMRPVTDRLHISREKLSYIVDSTAAPIAAIALITTWIGAELGYIQGALENINSEGVVIEYSPYAVFLGSLQYAFYPVLALLFILIIIRTNRDFGPMLAAERKARVEGVVSKKKTSEAQLDEFNPEPGAKLRMCNAIVPILVVVFGTIFGLLYTGSSTEIWSADEMGFWQKLSLTIGNSDSYQALLWSSMAGLIIAVLMSAFQRILSFTDAINTSLEGFKTMVGAVVILILAWSLAAITEEMHTADYLAGLAGDEVWVWTLPGLTFIISALVAFSTGSSWGTMAIVYPIMLPLAWTLAQASGGDIGFSMEIFLNTTSCVLAGAVLGDHCSPISDTTILSSLATPGDHITHVRTQMPYALTVGLVSVVFTTLSAAFSIPWYILFPIGGLILWLIVRYFGKPVLSEGL
jgi:Na+/H+ antiporter NhaC